MGGSLTKANDLMCGAEVCVCAVERYFFCAAICFCVRLNSLVGAKRLLERPHCCLTRHHLDDVVFLDSPLPKPEQEQQAAPPEPEQEPCPIDIINQHCPSCQWSQEQTQEDPRIKSDPRTESRVDSPIVISRQTPPCCSRGIFSPSL